MSDDDHDTTPPPGEYPDEATLEQLHHGAEPPDSEPAGVVDMSEVMREHEELDGACLYWRNVQALHELAATRTM